MRAWEVILPEQQVHFVVSKVTIRQDRYKFAIIRKSNDHVFVKSSDILRQHSESLGFVLECLRNDASRLQSSKIQSDTTMITTVRIFATTLILVSIASTVNAQTGGTGGFGTGTTGVGTTGGTAGGTTGTGSTAGTGGTTGTGTNAATAGTAGSGNQPTGAQAVSTLGSNATQSFIGSNATQGFIGGSATGNNQQRNNRQFQAIQNNNQQTTQQAAGTPRAIKTTLRVGFTFPSAPQLIIAGRIANANIASMDRFVVRRPELNGIDVDLHPNGLAVLTGDVPNEETRRLAANLMRLQPGVRKIENQLVVKDE